MRKLKKRSNIKEITLNANSIFWYPVKILGNGSTISIYDPGGY
jgi:hypothetical protein